MAALVVLCLAGCGRVVAQKATEQLIAGDAVDRSIAQIDFRILTGKKVYLDTQYVNNKVPGVGFVTSEYIVSSLRQKMMCDGCLLQEKVDQADFVVEMRVGALGADGHEIVFGMPPNNYAGLAASVTPASSAAAALIPSMPELSFAKKDDQMAAAKVALFAYNRRTREPIWQSGISESRSIAADRWYFGAGPFHNGSIYSKKQSDPSLFGSDESDPTKSEYFVERRFADPTKSLADNPPDPKPAVAAVAAAKPGVAAPAATTTPAVAVAPTAKPAATAPAATQTAATPAVATTTTTTATAPAAATATSTPAAVTTTNPPAPGPAVPVPAAAPTASAAPTVTATQTVNAAPAVQAPSNSIAPAVNPPSTTSVSPPAAAGPANGPSIAPKAVPSVNSLPNGQPVNGTAPMPNGASDGSVPDMLSVSIP
ncbi:MAG TPA: DUF6655 family protein [Planctomycetaceae bacterium]|jgi:hypothetical protein|nr:DUF6655 family protein [Planctomycetaceae bacterium]